MTPSGTTAWRVTAIPGDGIGPEVVAAAQCVLDAVGERSGFVIEWSQILMGGAAIDAYGVPIRDPDLAQCAASDAVLLGAVGGPKWDVPGAAVRPEQALLQLRKHLGLFANLRPVAAEPALIASSPLRRDLVEGVDMLIVRELTGGLYFGERQETHDGPNGRQAYDTLLYTEPEVSRIARLAFELARGRRNRVTSVDKANVLASSRLWRSVVNEVHAAEYPDVELEHRLVDSCAMQLITSPGIFDVMVTENMFGDILSDQAAALVGGMGMAPSADIGDAHGLFQPCHGSAPDIAGQRKANPTAAFLSAAMMLDWLAERSGNPELAAAALKLEGAVDAVFDSGRLRPFELGGKDGTTAIQDAVLSNL